MTKAPRAFRLDPAATTPTASESGARETFLSSGVVMIEEPEAEIEDQLSKGKQRSWRMPWLGILLSALGGLITLWIVIGIEQMVRHLLTTIPALGWTALAMAVMALIALLAIVIRELRGIFRERQIETLQKRAAIARENDDEMAAIAIVDNLVALYVHRPDMARARTNLAALSDDAIIDAKDRLNIAEQELLAPLDRLARRIVANRAKQVSLVTAISPRAIVDLAFVLYACSKMVRQIAALYGGRPGLLGFMRLFGNVLSHLALTGGIAVGDGIIQQVMGLGIAARVSAKLGEGVLNGLLTARVGLAAIEVCRPLPFVVVEPPRFTDVASGLFDRARKTEEATTNE